MKTKLTRFVLFAAFFLLTARRAYAYLDPGSGSYLFQLIIAGLLGAGFFIKSSWKYIVAFLKKRFKKK